MFTRKIAALMIIFVLAMSFESAPAAQAVRQPSHGTPHEEIRSSDGYAIGIKSTEADRGLVRQALSSQTVRMSARQIPYQSGSASGAGIDRPTGKPGFVPGGAPRADAQAVAQARYSEAWKTVNQFQSNSRAQQAAQSIVPYGTAGRFSSYATNYFDTMWTDNPWQEVGKLYVLDGANVYTCTASLIAPNVVVTAAHCVFNTDYDYWYDGWMFVPAERDGVAPYGEWTWDQVFFPTDWVNARYSSAGMKNDMAVISFPFTDGGGMTVSDYVGWLGRVYNLDAKQELHAIGYPIQTTNPVSGELYSFTCAAEAFQKGSDVLGLGCDMQSADGSPWIYKFTPYFYSVGNYVNAVTSGGIYGKTWGNTLYGPKFRSYNIEALCILIGC